MITNNHMSDREDIIKIVEMFFEIGKTKDLSRLKEIQLDDTQPSLLILVGTKEQIVYFLVF